MPQVQTLRTFIQQRLLAAAEEIFQLFERTIAEYEEKLCRQRKILDTVFKPQVHLHKAEFQPQSMSQEEVLPEQQERIPTLNQDNPPIKEEPEEIGIIKEGERLQEIKEADTSNVTFKPFPVRSDQDDEEQHQSSQLHHPGEMKTEADGEYCCGPKPEQNLNPDVHLQPHINDETSHSSQPQTDISCYLDETNEFNLGLTLGGNDEELESDTTKTPSCSSECATSFCQKRCQQEHIEVQTGKRTFRCSVCGKTFQIRQNLARHLRIHKGEKPFICSLCGKRFTQKQNLTPHMRIHTGERPFNCSVCGAKFTRKEHLINHTRTHTGEKPYICSVCDAKFTQKHSLTLHMRTHTQDKPFSCKLCGKKFGQNGKLRQHMRMHTGEKPFSCSVCDKSFACLAHLKKHTSVCERGRMTLQRSLLDQFLPAVLNDCEKDLTQL